MRKRPNIFLIVMDAVRADRLSCYGYERNTTPSIDEYSRRGTIFLETIANAPWTVPSVASMFTGLYPSEHGATQEYPRLDGDLPSLADMLTEQGYYCIGFSANPWFHKQSNLSKGFKEFHLVPEGKSIKRQLIRRAKRIIKVRSKKKSLFPHPGCSLDIVRDIMDRLEDILDNGRPFFLYAHFMDTHLPYQPGRRFLKEILEQGERKKIKDIMRNPLLRDGLVHVKYNLGLQALSQEHVDQFNLAYDAALLEVDAAIGTLLGYLMSKEAFAPSLVIITSDHGENIGDHGLMDHQLCLYDTLLKVPLIILGNGFPQDHKHIGQVQLHQLFYTILEVAGIKSWQNKSNPYLSLQDMVKNGGGLKYAFAEYARPDQIKEGYLRFSKDLDERFETRLKCARGLGCKYIISEKGEDEFYDLASDPGEKQDILHAATDDPRLSSLKSAIANWQDSLTTRTPTLNEKKDAFHEDEAFIQQLKSLGYM